MKKYIEPEIDIVLFDVDDVIVTSGGGCGQPGEHDTPESCVINNQAD